MVYRTGVQNPWLKFFSSLIACCSAYICMHQLEKIIKTDIHLNSNLNIPLNLFRPGYLQISVCLTICKKLICSECFTFPRSIGAEYNSRLLLNVWGPYRTTRSECLFPHFASFFGWRVAVSDSILLYHHQHQHYNLINLDFGFSDDVIQWVAGFQRNIIFTNFY